KEWALVFLREWVNHFTIISPVIKDPAFCAEREWRISRQVLEPDRPRMKFTQKQSMLTRHFALALRTRGAPPESKLLPITAIRIGTSRHKEITKISAQDFLARAKYPASVCNNVLVSEVPFQAL